MGPAPPARPSAAVLSFSPIDRDARVQRQIGALASICNVTAFGFSDPCLDNVQFVDVGPRPLTIPRKILLALRLKTGQFEDAYLSHEPVRKTAEALKDHTFALIVANDINTLPIALMCRGQARVLFDAHEYAPREFEDQLLWRFFFLNYIDYLCSTRVAQADAMTTVGPTIAQEYAREFGVSPAVVLNAPRYQEISFRPHEGDVIRMVHHGGTARSRRPEVMIDAMAHLDERFRLDLMLIPNDSAYFSRLRKLASSDPRITFVPPVPPGDIVERISNYDVGLYLLPPSSFNSRYALPNKFFDFVQAGLCVVIGPSPEMRELVERYDCGVTAHDFTAKALAKSLSDLDRQQVETFRRATAVAASELCYEHSEEVLLKTVRKLLNFTEDGRNAITRDQSATRS